MSEHGEAATAVSKQVIWIIGSWISLPRVWLDKRLVHKLTAQSGSEPSRAAAAAREEDELCACAAYGRAASSRAPASWTKDLIIIIMMPRDASSTARLLIVC